MMPPIERQERAGGPALWTVQRSTLPLIVGSFVLPSGSARDPDALSGLATLTGDALDAGTPARSLQNIADTLEHVGATVRTRTTHDGTLLTFSTVTKHLDDVFGVCADIWQHPVFPEVDVERLREQRLTALLLQKDRPGTIASLVFHRAVYGDSHPYGRDPGGDEEGLRAITVPDLRAFHATHYTWEPLVLIAVGDVHRARFGELFGPAFAAGRPASGSNGAALHPTPCAPRSVILVDKPDAPQSEVRIGLPALQRNSDDYIAAQVMNRILGGQFSSRLNANLRERLGLTYGAWSMFSPLRGPGPFIAGGAFHTNGTATAVRECFAEMDRMRTDGITEEERVFAVQSLAGSFALAFETPGQILQALQSIPLYDLPLDYFSTYLQRLRDVTRADVLGVAQRYLVTDAMTVVVVGDAASTRHSLEHLRIGPVDVR